MMNFSGLNNMLQAKVGANPQIQNSMQANNGGIAMADIFSRMKNKPNAPTNTPMNAQPQGSMNQGGYQQMPQDSRQNLLQAMLMRARGGQPSGAPNVPPTT